MSPRCYKHVAGGSRLWLSATVLQTNWTRSSADAAVATPLSHLHGFIPDLKSHSLQTLHHYMVAPWDERVHATDCNDAPGSGVQCHKPLWTPSHWCRGLGVSDRFAGVEGNAASPACHLSSPRPEKGPKEPTAGG